MPARRTDRGTRASRRLIPVVEGLDHRELMAAGGIAHSLGPYVALSQQGPRVTQPAKVVKAHDAVQDLLGSILGPGLDRIEARGAAQGNNPRSVLKRSVLNQPFVHAVLSNGDTYQLFASPAFNNLIGSQQVSGAVTTDAPATPPRGSSGTTPPATSGTTPGASAAANETIAFSIPQQATIQTIGATTSLVQVNPSNGVAGFFVEVPTSSIRVLDNGPPTTGSVLVPRSAIPAGFPVPTAGFISNGTFSPTYAETAPLLNEILDAGVKGVSPNAPNSVPGLRLVPFFKKNRVFPTAAARKDFLRAMRLAVQRDVFTLNQAQTDLVTAGLSQFAQQVSTLDASGEFRPAVPLAPPGLPSRPLAGTLQVSAGAVRRLIDVDPGVSGLQLPDLGNFPGRLDVGYVFDRAGNYGVIVTARGILLNANPGLRPADIVGGDVRIEVSNAANIRDLTGRRLVEGVQIGSFVSTDLGSSRYDNGISTFSASAGNGFGVEYGTGVGYSTVIPLGNVYSLIPSAPRR